LNNIRFKSPFPIQVFRKRILTVNNAENDIVEAVPVGIVFTARVLRIGNIINLFVGRLFALLVDFQKVVWLLLSQRLFCMTVDHIHTDRGGINPCLFDKFEAVLYISICALNDYGLVFGERNIEYFMNLCPTVRSGVNLLFLVITRFS